MSDKFRIHKSGERPFSWFMDYPDGFRDDDCIGEVCSTFATAVETFIKADQRRCPYCGRGAVVDTDTGWKCEACGSYDTAVPA